MITLSNLSKKNLREVWPHEATDFTPWLAENLALLGDELNINLEGVVTELSAGKYSADIVADVTGNGGKAIIENQLESTDHKHLGQIITYASAFDAKFILWVVADYNEEHKQAIDWLNRHIDDEIKFFLIQMEIYQIDDSKPAPKFTVICEPNEWARVAKSSADGNKVSDTKLMQHEYWEQLIKDARNRPLSLSFNKKARPQHWYSLAFGTSRAGIGLNINTQKNILGCEIYITNDQELYERFEANKEQIQDSIGHEYELDWMPLENRTASRIAVRREASNIRENENWPQYNDWFIEMAEKFAQAFRPFIK